MFPLEYSDLLAQRQHFERSIRAAAEEDPASCQQREKQIEHKTTVVTPRNPRIAAVRKLLIRFDEGVLSTHNGRVQPVAAFHPRQESIYGSWVTSTWLMKQLVERLVRWNGHPSDLITHRFPLEQVSAAYSLMASGRCGKLAVCFDEELTVSGRGAGAGRSPGQAPRW